MTVMSLEQKLTNLLRSFAWQWELLETLDLIWLETDLYVAKSQEVHSNDSASGFKREYSLQHGI